ncbi:purine-nucleoside phosphorylase [Naumannella halotolerans]|uniref:purine-nucleoside phosphorylase n=1 Tax=Naumannella halotolerans TaxID=993414 RepID=UPI00370D3BAB
MSTNLDDPAALAEAAARTIRRDAGIDTLDLAMVLGSGWSAAADDLGTVVHTFELADLPGFSAPVVAGHGGQLRIVETPNRRIAGVFTGRTHFYEGRGAVPVVHGVRTAAAAGATAIVLTNGCGSLNPDWGPGTPVLIADHINLTGASPLAGATFIDLTDAYSRRLRELAREVDPALPEGVYVQFRGPQYETPAEVRMAKVLGGDLVGMSTALETIAAREAGMEVLGISLATNLAAGISPTPLDHAEVIEAGQAAAPKLRSLLRGLAERL